MLKLYLENYFGRPRRTVLALRSVAFSSYESLLPYFRSADGLARWLTSSGSIPERTGESCSLELRDGGRMSGRVFSLTARDVAMTWSEIDGFVQWAGFKAWGPPGRMISVKASGWNISADADAELEKRLEAALDRLVAAL